MIDYTNDIQPREADGVTFADIAAGIEASDKGYVDLTSPSIAQWLAENGLRVRVDAFLDQPLPAKADPTYKAREGLRGGLLQLIGTQPNPAATLSVAPSVNGPLVALAVGFGVMDEVDVANLMKRARPGWQTVTADTVAAVTSAHVRRLDAQALADWANAQYQAMLARIGEAGPLPTRADLAALVDVGAE